MARLNPISIPSGVEVSVNAQHVSIKGGKGSLEHTVHASVEVQQQDNTLSFIPREGMNGAIAQSGTARAVLNNMMTGVTEGYEKKLELVGVGYRAQVQGKTLNLTLGFSHPVNYAVPEGITIDTPRSEEHTSELQSH